MITEILSPLNNISSQELAFRTPPGNPIIFLAIAGNTCERLQLESELLNRLDVSGAFPRDNCGHNCHCRRLMKILLVDGQSLSWKSDMRMSRSCELNCWLVYILWIGFYEWGEGGEKEEVQQKAGQDVPMPSLDPCDASAVENRSTSWLLSLY
jgi:hypothetical protein